MVLIERKLLIPCKLEMVSMMKILVLKKERRMELHV